MSHRVWNGIGNIFFGGWLVNILYSASWLMSAYFALHLLQYFSALFLFSLYSVHQKEWKEFSWSPPHHEAPHMHVIYKSCYITQAISHYTRTVLMLFCCIDFSLLTPDQPFVLWMSFWCTLCCAQIRLKHFCWDPFHSLPSGSVQMAPESIRSGSLSFSRSLSIFRLSLSEGQEPLVHEFRKPQCCFHDYQMSPVAVESRGKWKSERRTQWRTCIFCLFVCFYTFVTFKGLKAYLIGTNNRKVTEFVIVAGRISNGESQGYFTYCANIHSCTDLISQTTWREKHSFFSNIVVTHHSIL